MSTQVYECPVHGEFEVKISFKDDVPNEMQCPDVRARDPITENIEVRHCSEDSKHVLKPPAAIIIAGGTGAGSGRR